MGTFPQDLGQRTSDNGGERPPPPHRARRPAALAWPQLLQVLSTSQELRRRGRRDSNACQDCGKAPGDFIVGRNL